MKVLIIIPAYNEQENICHVVDGLASSCPEYDYVVVNDCSTDRTADICRARGYRYLDLPVNLGIGGCVQTGYLYAWRNGYDVAVQFDGDGQHDAGYLKDLIRPVVEGELDMAIGSRFIDGRGFQSSGLRRLGISILKRVIRACCGHDATDATSGFRACSRAAIGLFAKNYAQDYPEPEAILTAVLNGLRVGDVPVAMKERVGGASSISGLKSANYMIKVSLALILYRLTIGSSKRREAK